MTTMLEIPTPAMDADPSLPIHIMSMKGPSIMMLVLMVMGQARDQRLLVMLPFVQSRCIGDFSLPESSLFSTKGNYSFPLFVLYYISFNVTGSID
jgi:hypothetical protein